MSKNNIVSLSKIREIEEKRKIFKTRKKIFKTEEKCRKIFEKKFNRSFKPIWHSKIVNPRTGHSLQLDGFNRELNIAFEYNGEQHYRYPNIWHNNEDEFKQQLYRDNIKRKRCKELGIKLIEIPYTKRYNLESYIYNQLSN